MAVGFWFSQIYGFYIQYKSILKPLLKTKIVSPSPYGEGLGRGFFVYSQH